MSLKNNLKIVSRDSPLALVQANIVKDVLSKLYPEKIVEIIGVTTLGDKILDKSLDKIGGKGLFIKELELCLLNKEADFAVHSLKDLPAKLLPEFDLAAILKREDVSDAFISNIYNDLNEVPANGIIGTSSPRRIAILKKYYPHLKTKLLRGNLQTRLKKMDLGEYDGIILATAGLKRLGLEHRIKQKLDVQRFIPAIGQAALAIEILHDNEEFRKIVAPLSDIDTAIAVNAERHVGYCLGASCSLPIGVFAEIHDNMITISSMVADTEESYYFSEVTGSKQDALILAERCARQLIDQGASDILNKYK